MTADRKKKIEIEPDHPQTPVHAPGRRNDPAEREPNPESDPDAGIEEPGEGEGEGTPTEVDVPNEDR